MRLPLFLLLLAAASTSSAQEKLLVLVPAINKATGPGTGRTTSECLLEEIVGNDVFRAVADKVPGAEKIKNPAEAGNDKYLSVTITSVIGWGGGGWSGSKLLGVRAEIIQGKQVLQVRNLSDRSRGGVLGPVKGTCAIFEDISAALAPRIALFAARNRGGHVAEPEGAEAKAESEPASEAKPSADPEKK